MDQNGYVLGGVSFLLVLPIIVLFMVAIDVELGISTNNIGEIQSDTVYAAYKDFESNIPVLGREVLLEKSGEVIKTKQPLINSRDLIKHEIQLKINKMAVMYNNKGFDSNCSIISVAETENPYFIEINSSISLFKGGKRFSKNISQRIPLSDQQDPLTDPIPFLKCQNYGGVHVNGSRIFYGQSLAAYLNARNVSGSERYENATSPLYIRKCPYEPLNLHGCGNYANLKNCIANGYYHESNDGACFLCRLEGKSTCSHQGLEVFIIPTPLLNETNISAPCSIDHVIFSESNNEIYPGYPLKFFQEEIFYHYIFLDNSHRIKYGLPSY
jgi:hypothetical protein